MDDQHYQQLPEKIALSIKAIVLRVDPDGLVLGFANPQDQDAIAIAEHCLNAYIKPVKLEEEDVMRRLRLLFRKVNAIQAYADSMMVYEEQPFIAEIVQQDDSHIATLVKLIVQDALDMQASDIHLEVAPESLKVRLRIDGLLQEYPIYRYAIRDHLVRYLKLLADIDITEQVRPTEGKKVTLTLDGQEVNLRLSFLPTYDGQSVAIRLLRPASAYVLKENIHHWEYQQAIRDYLARGAGLLLMSGPTGSGKTTTLYSALQEVNQSSTKIITLEDPIEARLPGIIQIQMNDAVGFHFADAIRAVLHQDPDVLMVGEVRDELAASMLIRAAMTGHLVLATIHAKGVVDIPLRLLNLGVDPYLLASAMQLNVSQRLVRCLCLRCRGDGCHYCQQTGIFGREAVVEWLWLTPEMIDALARNAIADYLVLAREAMKGKTLKDHADRLVQEGRIPLSEALRCV